MCDCARRRILSQSWRRRFVNALQLHSPASCTGFPVFATDPCATAVFTTINALISGVSFLDAATTRPRYETKVICYSVKRFPHFKTIHLVPSHRILSRLLICRSICKRSFKRHSKFTKPYSPATGARLVRQRARKSGSKFSRRMRCSTRLRSSSGPCWYADVGNRE